MSQITTHPVSRISGEYTPPSDKSISHRLAMLGALADGTSEFSYFLEAEDCLGTIQAFEAMGVSFERSKGILIAHGVGLNGLSQPKADLYLGNSGTTMRLLLGILAGQDFETRLTGDPSLSKRPMKRVTEPLRKMGARISGRDDANFAPLTVRGGALSGIKWVNKIASAQVKSAVLLAGLFAEGETLVEELEPSRDHTERLLTEFGVPVKRTGQTVSVGKTKRLEPIRFEVPGDISSAAFLMVAALIVPDSDLTIRRVGLNPTRLGLLEILKKMGANLSVEQTGKGAEPVGNIHVKSSRLKGVTIGKDMIPFLIDELPILMIACALAEGTSTIGGAEELRFKETDRIHSIVTGLKAIGGQAEERPDGCVIRGIAQFQGGTVQSLGDHRTAMSFAIAGLKAKKQIEIEDTDCIQTSYPRFEADLKAHSR